jgi:hypothetical protein
LATLQGTLEVVFQAGDLPGKWSQTLDVHANAAAVLQHFPIHSLAGGFQEHTQAALLPGSPNIGRLAAAGGFIEIPGQIRTSSGRVLELPGVVRRGARLGIIRVGKFAILRHRIWRIWGYGAGESPQRK